MIDSLVLIGKPLKRNQSSTDRFITKALAFPKVLSNAGLKLSHRQRQKQIRRSKSYGMSLQSPIKTTRFVSALWIRRISHAWTLKVQVMFSSKPILMIMTRGLLTLITDAKMVQLHSTTGFCTIFKLVQRETNKMLTCLYFKHGTLTSSRRMTTFVNGLLISSQSLKESVRTSRESK